MQTDLRGRDLITTQEWTKEEIETLLDVAWDLKRKRATGESHAYLRDKVLALLFFFTSTRTRASFEAGMAQLGGHAMFVDSETTQISHGDTAKEIGQIVEDLQVRMPSLARHSIRLQNAAGGGVLFFVDGQLYQNLEDIPTLEIQALIRAATKQWERQ